MQRRWLEMQDYLTLHTKSLEPSKKHLFECKDNTSSSGHSLLATLAATHSAVVNGNQRFYRSDKMLAAVPTWTNKPIAVPVLREHNKQGDVYGRVRTAKYIDETHKFDQDYPILRDTAFYSTDSNKIPLFDSIDWIVENLVGQDDYTGLGYIELGAQITNPEAIRKLLNDEFLSVSVGFKTDQAICSICHTDWAQEDKCNHKLGSQVNGKDTFLITGNLDYNEVSFVNFAADPFATTLSIEQLSDSLTKRFYLGLSHDKQQDMLDVSGLTLTDSITYDDDIAVYYEDSMNPKDLTLESLDIFIPEIKSKELTAAQAFEYKTIIDSLSPDKSEDKSKVRGIKSTLNARIKREKWTEVTDTISEEMEVALQPVVTTDSVKTSPWEGFTYANEDEKAFFEDSEGIATEIKIEFANYTDSVTDEDAFCGPNKSFAVTDSDSANACKAVVAKAPISAETKQKINECITARETTLGLNAIDGLDSVQAFTDAKTGVPEKVLGHYTELHSAYVGGDPMLRQKMIGLHYAVADHWSATSRKETSEKALINSGHNVNAYGDAIIALDKFYTEATDSDIKAKIILEAREAITKWEPNIVFVDSSNFTAISTVELADKEEAINQLTADLTAEKAKSVAFFKESKKALATQIIMSKVITGTDGFKDLTPEKLNEKITELATRNIVSLRDSVKDILTEQKFVTAGQDSQETRARVAETTQVSESDAVSLTDSQENNTEESQVDPAIIAGAFKYLSPSERARFFAEMRYSK